jgi:hypothetical protein
LVPCLQRGTGSLSVRASRDRLLQFRLQLQQPPLTTPAGEEADGAGAALLKEAASGLIDLSFGPLEMGARGLSTIFKLAAMNGVAPSLPLEFGEIPDEQLFDCLLTMRLPRRPVSQVQAFARVEAAYYAVKCIQEHFIPRCVQRLGYPCPAYATNNVDDEASQDSLSDTDDEESQDGGEIGLPDLVAAATEDLAKIGLLDLVAAATEGLSKIDLSDPDAATTECTGESSKAGLQDPAPAPTAGATGETLQLASIDLDQARTYLDRACTLATLASKSIDLAVTTISSFADRGENGADTDG